MSNGGDAGTPDGGSSANCARGQGGGGSSCNNTLATKKPRAVLAFFTTGDWRLFAPGLPFSELFHKRADALVALETSQPHCYGLRDAKRGYVYGVNNVQGAIDKINKLPRDLKLAQVFFVGHGDFNSYYFHGRPGSDPGVDFEAPHDAILMDPKNVPDAEESNKALYSGLIDALAVHFTETDWFEIGFICCYSGANNLIFWVSQVLKDKNFLNFLVGGYKNHYKLHPTANKSGAYDQWGDVILDQKTQTQTLAQGYANYPPAYETTSSFGKPPTDPQFDDLLKTP
jgi:hypothetical protein